MAPAYTLRAGTARANLSSLRVRYANFSKDFLSNTGYSEFLKTMPLLKL